MELVGYVKGATHVVDRVVESKPEVVIIDSRDGTLSAQDTVQDLQGLCYAPIIIVIYDPASVKPGELSEMQAAGRFIRLPDEEKEFSALIRHPFSLQRLEPQC